MLPTAILCGVLSGCTVVDAASADRFSADGRLIAVSGGGSTAANACFTCHGLDGDGNGAGSPRLAGLDEGYLARQLEAYADGRREHSQMSWIAKRLSHAERQAVSTYYSRLPPRLADGASADRLALYHEGDPSRGLAACSACHGEQGEGIGPANPPLAGQPAGYLAEQLDLWREARRRNDPGGVMLRISQLLTPSESRALARYASAQSGRPPSPGSPAASPSARRDGPRSDASAPPLHVPESARAAK